MNPLQQTQRVEVRLATKDEQARNIPSGFSWAWQECQAALNTLHLKQSGGDLIKFFGKPIPMGTPFKMIRTLTNLHWCVYSSPAIFEALADHHRNTHEGLFANDVAAQVFIKIGTRIFGEPLAPEETISTCGPQNSKIYRRLFMRNFGLTAISPALINELAGKLLDEWDPHREEMNVTEMCQRLVSAYLNCILFDLEADESLHIAKSIVAANAYILADATGDADETAFEPHVQVLRHAIDRALLKNTPFVKSLHSDEYQFTSNQKKALIIVVYFTGLGGTISQMSGLLWHLAKSRFYQEELFREITAPSLAKAAPQQEESLKSIESMPQDTLSRKPQEERITKKFPFLAKLIVESFRIHPSTLTIDRPTRQPLMITFQDGETTQEIYIPEKTILTFYQPWAAENCANPAQFNPHRPDQVKIYPFGRGIHQCVGQQLAEELIGRFIYEFNRRFVASTSMETLPLQGYFNLEPKMDVVLTVQPWIKD